ncbi:MAG: radical SAM protein [Kiritimatiellae bacterium]|nr:radical SAM protein [Kiritimatiellia bacterium]MDD5519589.1 radical SAM protein [Kiritimatiellia bacterium]
MKKIKKSTVFGTKEWAEKTANCCDGCGHDCHYCYAKSMAIRFTKRTGKTPNTWLIEEPALHRIQTICRGKPAKVMFPSMHDLTPNILPVCIEAIRMMLDYGHRLLIVSKPHEDCIREICETFSQDKSRILFRFTIGSASDETLRFWESGSPCFQERLLSLALAHDAGFATSVSCEPMLDDRIELVVDATTPWVTDSIWIGKMNQLRQRLRVNGAGPDVLARGEALLESQNDKNIRHLYMRLKDNPIIKWKESIKRVIGAVIPTKPGLDI